MESLPIIRLEVEYMKHAICHAFSQHQMQLDEAVKAAVDTFCQPDHINGIVADAVDRTLRDGVQKAVESFFRYGAGGDTIKEQVIKKLSAYTPRQKRSTKGKRP